MGDRGNIVFKNTACGKDFYLYLYTHSFGSDVWYVNPRNKIRGFFLTI